jgi:hypothetical protein
MTIFYDPFRSFRNPTRWRLKLPVTEPYRPQRKTRFDIETSNAMRADVASGNYTLPSIEAMYGIAVVITYTGPGAVCPDCGNLVTHGDPAMRFSYDFAGYGRFSLTPVYVHLEPCRVEREVIGNK